MTVKRLIVAFVLLVMLVSCADVTVIEGTQEQSESSTQSGFSSAGTVEGGEYVANTSTKKYHTQFCSDVERMLEENMLLTFDIPSLVDKGYSPCEKCIARTAK